MWLVITETDSDAAASGVVSADASSVLDAGAVLVWLALRLYPRFLAFPVDGLLGLDRLISASKSVWTVQVGGVCPQKRPDLANSC